MLKFNCLASFLLLLLVVANSALAEALEGQLHRPGTSLEELRSKEINITDIIQILEEHEKDLTNLRILQGQTIDVIAGNLKRKKAYNIFQKCNRHFSQ